jgi:hypothetical protein
MVKILIILRLNRKNRILFFTCRGALAQLSVNKQIANTCRLQRLPTGEAMAGATSDEFILSQPPNANPRKRQKG